MSGRWRLVLALVPVAAGIVAGVVLLAVPHGTERTTCLPLHAPAPAAARRALASYADRIEYTLDRSGDGSRDQTWADPVSGDYRQLSHDSDGSTDEFGTVLHGRIDMDYWLTFDDRMYTVDTTHEPASAVSPLPRNDAAEIAQLNRDGVLHKTIALLGRANLDGRTALHLRQLQPAVEVPPPKGPPELPSSLTKRMDTIPAVRFDTWVDPLTYVPFRMKATSAGQTSVIDYRWLPRTPTTIALTQVTIPPGFKRQNDEQVSSGSFQITLHKFGKSGCAQ